MAQLQRYAAPCSHACNIDGTHLALVLMCPLVQRGAGERFSISFSVAQTPTIIPMRVGNHRVSLEWLGAAVGETTSEETV